jgi:FdhD protein
VTLRTPGEDRELAAGFVLTEGVARRATDLESIEPVEDGPPEARGNVVDVRLLQAGAEAEGSASASGGASAGASRLTGRPAFITAACGVCGRGTLEAVRRRAEPLPDGPVVAREILASLPERLRPSQDAETAAARGGTLHLQGNLPCRAIGRHNAVDKPGGGAGRPPTCDARRTSRRDPLVKPDCRGRARPAASCRARGAI